jgi:pimeloyl-ACP methyl ester carboxylesterase
MKNPDFLVTPDGRRLAYHFRPGSSPVLVFLCGLCSDMNGNKAMHLDAYCRDHNQACLRLDYQGHGESSGEYLDGGIGPWSEDALAVIRHVTKNPLILVGSSMGAWIMLLLARQLQTQVQALVGLAAAVDFSEDVLWSALSEQEQSEFIAQGVIERPSCYDEGPWSVGIRLIEDGREHLQLRDSIPVHCPVRLLHGTADEDIPWSSSQRLMEQLESRDVRLTLIKHADHRLSTDRDLALLDWCLDELLELGQRLIPTR